MATRDEESRLQLRVVRGGHGGGCIALLEWVDSPDHVEDTRYTEVFRLTTVGRFRASGSNIVMEEEYQELEKQVKAKARELGLTIENL